MVDDMKLHPHRAPIADLRLPCPRIAVAGGLIAGMVRRPAQEEHDIADRDVERQPP